MSIQRDYSHIGSITSVQRSFNGSKLPAGLTASAPFPGEHKGVLAIADQYGSCVRVFSLNNGKAILKTGTRGDDEGQFSNPQDVAFDRRGNLWVADTSNSRLHRFAQYGNVWKAVVGENGTAPGCFMSPVSLQAFSSQSVNVASSRQDLLVVDSQNHRLQIHESSGKVVTFGSIGDSSNCFNTPLAATWHAAKALGDIVNVNRTQPSWFAGDKSREECQRLLYLDPEPIDSFLVRQVDDTRISVCYVSPRSARLGTIEEREILTNPTNGGFYLGGFLDETTPAKKKTGKSGREAKKPAQSTLLFSRLTYPTLFDLLLAHDEFFTPPKDDRHISRIAVADSGNKRVSIIGYRSRIGDFYDTRLHGLTSIGGGASDMFDCPCSVAYSQDCDLVVCDSGYGRFLIFTQHHALSHQVQMEGNNKSVPPPISMGESFSLTGRPQGVTWKHGCPVSVAFTCEDQLIVGTKSGAVALMSGSVLSERLGVFGVLSHAFIVDLVSFLQYEDAQVLREVCRLFHDTTKRMRDAWCLHPLRPNQLAYVKQLFVNWSRLPDGQKVSHTAALDASGAPVCRDWMRDGECSHPYCPLSHSPPVVDLDLLETTAVVELNHGLYGAVSELFGAKWWWEREAQIRPLFHHYATAAVKSAQHPQEDRTAHALLEPIDRCDRSIHERAVEVVRERAVMVTSQVLRLDAFVAVMTVLMETKLHLVELREHVSLRAIHPSRAVRNRRTRIRGEHLNPLEAHLDIVNYQTSRCVAAINALF